jgi:predicted DCC family thiol-disulfide oxidoreductase YuxK
MITIETNGQVTIAPRDWVLWDGECGFCRRSIAWFQARDHGERFIFVAYQQAPMPPLTPTLYAACAHSVHVIKATGEVLKEGAAVLYILEACGYPGLARLGQLPGVFTIVQWTYRLVARNRTFFSRFLFTRE